MALQITLIIIGMIIVNALIGMAFKALFEKL